MVLDLSVFIIILLLFLVAFVKRGLFFLHMFQLESYKSKKFIKWYDENENRILTKAFKINFVLILLFIIVFFICFKFFDHIFNERVELSIFKRDRFFNNFSCFLIIYFIVFSLYIILQKTKPQKKPFVFTPRARRLFTTYLMITILILFSFFYFLSMRSKLCFTEQKCKVSSNLFEITNFPLFIMIFLILIDFIPYLLFVSNYIIYPIERNIQKKFYNLAMNKIRKMKHLIVIGITGSYGKTSTKYITGTILKHFFQKKVLITPESYNTTMGVCKVINNQLNKMHKLFIVEMGARQIGDIKEIADLVSPQFGIITAIGEVHLETFKTIDNIIKTKFELFNSLIPPAISILNGDNKYIVNYIEKNDNISFKIRNNIIFYGIKEFNEEEKTNKLDIYAKNICINEQGVEFDLFYNKEKFYNIFKILKKHERYNKIFDEFQFMNQFFRNKNTNLNNGYIKAKTILLGKHNIYNIIAAVSIALLFGIGESEIEKAIGNLKPVKHRLELINPGTGILIIDDAFNSNPEGAKIALDVLHSFKQKRKIIVTPGIIEMGDKEEEINYKFGEKISSKVDIAILVKNKVSDYIIKGIKDNGFNQENIYYVNGLDEAKELLQKILKRGDIVLFENDLPDNLEY